MLLPQPQFRNSLLAAGLAVVALGMNCQAFGEAAATVPGAAGAVIDTKISLKAPAPFAKAEQEPTEAKAPDPSKAVIPEPAAAALGLIGIGLILFRRYRV